MSDIELSSLMPPPMSTSRPLSNNNNKKAIPSAGMFTYDIYSHAQQQQQQQQQNSSLKRNSISYIGNNKYGFATNTNHTSSRPPTTTNTTPSKRGGSNSRPPPSPSARSAKNFFQWCGEWWFSCYFLLSYLRCQDNRVISACKILLLYQQNSQFVYKFIWYFMHFNRHSSLICQVHFIHDCNLDDGYYSSTRITFSMSTSYILRIEIKRYQ